MIPSVQYPVLKVPACGESPRLPVLIQRLSLLSLKANIYITLTLMDAQWVIFQFLDAPQFLHIYSIDLFLVEIDA